MGDQDGQRNIGGNSAKGIVYVLLSAVFFSLAGVLIKAVDWSALSVSGARSLFAAAVLYIFLRMQGKRMSLNGPIIAGAAINFVMLQTFIFANKMTTAANAIVLQFTMPAWLILMLWAITRERPTRSSVMACIAIFLGIVCFFFDQLTPEGLWGNIIAVVSGIAYAGVFLIKRIPGCDFECAAVISFLACAICGVPSIVNETDFSLPTLAAIVALGVVQVGLAYVFLSKGLDLVDPITASLTSTIEPILNPLLVAVFIGEMIGPLSLVGALLVIGSATAYNVHEARKNTGGEKGSGGHT